MSYLPSWPRLVTRPHARASQDAAAEGQSLREASKAAEIEKIRRRLMEESLLDEGTPGAAASATVAAAPPPTRLSHEDDLERMMSGGGSGMPALARGANPYVDTAQHPSATEYAASTQQSEVV